MTSPIDKLLVVSNGRTMTVRVVSDPVLILEAGDDPLPVMNGILPAKRARNLTRDLIDTQRYKRTL